MRVLCTVVKFFETVVPHSFLDCLKVEILTFLVSCLLHGCIHLASAEEEGFGLWKSVDHGGNSFVLFKEPILGEDDECIICVKLHVICVSVSWEVFSSTSRKVVDL